MPCGQLSGSVRPNREQSRGEEAKRKGGWVAAQPARIRFCPGPRQGARAYPAETLPLELKLQACAHTAALARTAQPADRFEEAGQASLTASVEPDRGFTIIFLASAE